MVLIEITPELQEVEKEEESMDNSYKESVSSSI